MCSAVVCHYSEWFRTKTRAIYTYIRTVRSINGSVRSSRSKMLDVTYIVQKDSYSYLVQTCFGLQQTKRPAPFSKIEPKGNARNAQDLSRIDAQAGYCLRIQCLVMFLLQLQLIAKPKLCTCKSWLIILLVVSVTIIFYFL